MEESLLRFFSYHQSRRIRVVENVLKNRRTVANLFWAQQYGILRWLGADRRLARTDYDRAIHSLVSQQLLLLEGEQQARLTEKGVAVLEDKRSMWYEPSFYDWFWLANTQRVQERLLLAIQVVSEFAYHQRKYVPLQASFGEMQVVKQWFRQNYQHDIVHQLYTDLQRFTTAIASENEILAIDFTNMLVGHENVGWTNDQASHELKLAPGEVQFLRHDEMLAVAAYAAKLNGPLHQLLSSLLNLSPLSRSAQLTLDRYQQGVAFAKIAQQRRLKENTIREHLLEAAILTPNQLSWARLLPADKRRQLAKKYQGNPADWHYQGAHTDNQAFFEYRLYQILRGDTHGS